MKKVDSKINPEELREQIKSGKTYKQLMEHFDCSKSCIKRHRIKYKIRERVKTNNKRQFDVELLKRLYIKERFTIKELAAFFKCHPIYMAIRLGEYGIKKAPDGLFESDIEEMKKLYLEDGWTSKRISEHFGCSHKTVRQFFWIYGIKKGVCEEIEVDKDLLKKLYVEDKMLLKDIAKIMGHKANILGIKAKKFGFKKLRKELSKNKKD